MKYIVIGAITIIFLCVIFSLSYTASECSREEEERWAREQEKQNQEKKDIDE